MSITRREFILGTGAGLILPSYYDKVSTFFENHGEPLIDLPIWSDQTLFARNYYEGFEFLLGGLEFDPPQMTRAECARRYFYDKAEYASAHGCEPRDIDFDEFEDEGMVFTSWTRQDSPAARAYRLLKNIDLGSELDGEQAVGHLEFLDCPNPFSVYLGVQTEDGVSLSLLQKRLNDLNTNIDISIVADADVPCANEVQRQSSSPLRA